MVNARILLYRLRHRFARLTGRQITDDFDWASYSLHYRGELASISKEHTLVLRDGDYTLEAGELLRTRQSLLPLHPNHRLLYETILQLWPKSVFELGCGGGDHLANLAVLVPGVTLYGVDISPGQLALLRQRHPRLAASVAECDAKRPFPEKAWQADVAYTQAVLMHIQTGDGHLVALENLFRTARKQVVLMENWTRHAYVDDIRRLHADGRIPWPDVHLYFRRSPEFGRPHLMIASSVPLANYEPLTDGELLRDAMAVGGGAA
jgi:SAM-dependent methyltransferase